MIKEMIGARLRFAREEAGLSRDHVIALPEIGISRSTLQQWESGNTEASLETLDKLSKLYGVSPQYLIFGDTDTQSSPASDIAAISAEKGISVEDAIDTLKTMIQDTQPKLTEEEAFLLKEFRALDDDQRRMMLRFIIGGFDGLNNNGGNKGIFNSPKSKVKNSFNE